MVKYAKTTKIHPCRLSKEDLHALIDKIRSDFPASKRREDFQISSNMDELRISENSLEDFLRHSELPPTITRLTIEIIGWSKDSQIDKSVDISFYDSFINLRVSGTSESWVKGKYNQLTDYLKKKRPFLWFLHTPTTYIIRGAIFATLSIEIGWITSQWITNGFSSIGVLLPISVVILSLLNWVIGKFAYIKIYLAPQKSFTEKYNDSIAFVGIVAAIFTIIGVILQLVK